MLQLEYDVTADEHGVFDGRVLARMMIAHAFDLLVPYVEACPACADQLFSLIANEVLAQAHADGLSGILLVPIGAPGSAERADAQERHLAAAAETTRALLQTGGHTHH